MANTYAFAIFGALLLALTLAPVLCSFLFHNKKEESDTFVDRIMKRRYLRALNRVLNYRWLTLGVMLGLLLFTATLVPGLGGEFMPQLEEGNLWIRALLPRTVSLEDAARMAPRLREVIASVPEIKGVMSHVGRPDDGTDVTSFFNLEFNAPLRPMEAWRTRRVEFAGVPLWKRTITREEIQDELMEQVPRIPGHQLQLLPAHPRQRRGGALGRQGGELGQAPRHRPEDAGGGRPARRQRPQDVPGIENVGLFHIVGQPNLEIEIDRRDCARYGVNVADVEAAVQVAIGGRAFSQMVEGEKLYDIVLRLPTDLRDDPTVISRIPIDTPGGPDGQPGVRIPLGQLATIHPHKPGAAYIYRENNRRFIPIKFSVRNRDLASAIAEAKQKVEDPKTGAMLPEGL